MTTKALLAENKQLKAELKQLSIDCEWAIRHVGVYFWCPKELIQIQEQCLKRFKKSERKMLYV